MLKKSLTILGITVCALAFSLHMNYANGKYGIEENKSSQVSELVYTDTTKKIYKTKRGDNCVFHIQGDVKIMGTRINCGDTERESTCVTDHKCYSNTVE